MSIRRIAYEKKIYSTDDANGPTALPRYSLTLSFAAMASGAASMRRRSAWRLLRIFCELIEQLLQRILHMY
jgi:hypothetical protein